jgi:Flp pilus assembly protein TadD
MIVVLAALAAGCQNPDALRHAGLGTLALDADDLRAALAEFEAAAQLDSGLATAFAGMGDVYAKQGQMEKAIRPYQQAVAAMPYEFTYHFRLGTVYQVLERDKEAAKTYENAVALNPDDPPVNINLGVVYFRIALADPDKPVRDAVLAKGLAYAQKAVELAPKHGFAWSNLGAIYDALGDSYKAVGAYHKSIELDPNQAPVHINLGMAYLQQGRLDKALEEFRTAQQREPDSPIIRKCLARIYSQEKKYGAAIEQLQAILEKDPGDWDARNRLAAIYMIFYLRHPEQDRLRLSALEEWHQSLEANSDQPQVKAQVARPYDGIEGFLFYDGVANLHGTGGKRLGLFIKLAGGESHAVDAVAPCFASHQQDQVAGLLAPFLGHIGGHYPHRAAVDQRIAHIALVETNSAVGGRDAHAVAVIGHAGADAFKDTARVQHAFRQVGMGQIGRAEAEDIRI